MARRVALSLWMLAALLVVTTLTASGIGALRLPISLLWNGTDESLRQIWLTIRLPRVLLALAIGGSLALAGCVMQGLFRNPLADPGLLGISSGAALAVALWVVLPLSLPALVMLYAPMMAAFLGALAATFVIFLLSRQRDASLSRLLLVGIAINALCGAAVGVLSWLSNDAQLRQLSLWGMGSLGQAQWSTLLAVASLMIPTVLVIWRLAGPLNLLQLGDEEAHYLGVEVAAVQRILLLCSALLVAAAVAVSGVIGFAGLVVPHLVRMWLGADHRAYSLVRCWPVRHSRVWRRRPAGAGYSSALASFRWCWLRCAGWASATGPISRTAAPRRRRNSTARCCSTACCRSCATALPGRRFWSIPAPVAPSSPLPACGPCLT